jgi:hypothetical protein
MNMKERAVTPRASGTGGKPLTPVELARLDRIARSIWPEPHVHDTSVESMAARRRRHVFRERVRRANRLIGVTAMSWLAASGLLLAVGARLWQDEHALLGALCVMAAIMAVAGVVAWASSMALLLGVVRDREKADSDPA